MCQPSKEIAKEILISMIENNYLKKETTSRNTNECNLKTVCDAYKQIHKVVSE